MDEGSAKSEENARYSFLLGSALRNEDTEQFLRVYDAVMPKDLPPEQVGAIKERAREIAVLSQEEFNVLVTQTHLADTVTGPNTCSGMSAALQHPSCNILDEEATAAPSKHAVKSFSCTGGSVGTGAAFGLLEGTTDGTRQEDENDSGVFNLSRNTTGSMSDDTEMADEFESRGVFNYLPQRLKSSSLAHAMDNIELRYKNDNAYDDAELALDSDNEDGNGGELLEVVVDKTMDSTIRGAIEMKTFRMEATACMPSKEAESDSMVENLYRTQHNHQLARLNTLQYDEAELVDDDEYQGDSAIIPHQQLLSRNVGRHFSMLREDSEDYDAESPEAPRLSLSSSSRRVWPKASDGVRIEQEVRQRSHGGMKMPPFGDPVNVDKVVKSAERLIHFNTPTNQDVRNMPAAERIRNHAVGNKDKDSEGNNTETATKKKKKKKKNKDDGEESNRNKKYSSMDINGNPMTERNSSLVGSSNSCSSAKVTQFLSTFPRTMDQTTCNEINGQPIADMDDLSSTKSERDQQKKTRATRPTRRREQEAAQMRKSEEIEGFRGKAKIEELVHFIESTGTVSKKQKKKIATSAGIVVNGIGGDGGTGGLPNGDVGNESFMGLTTKNGRKPKQNNNKGKPVLVSVLKDCDKSCSEGSSSEKADDSSSGGKSEGDERKDTEVPSPGSTVNSTTTRTKVAAPDTEQPKAVDTAAKAELVSQAEAPKDGGMEERPKSVTASSCLQSFPSSIKDLDDPDVFIFTDFDNVQPLSEGEFNVVTRKKRQRAQQEPPLFRGGNQVRENHHYDPMYGGYRYNHLLAPREDRCDYRLGGPMPQRSRPMVRSVTPPPITSTPSVEKDPYYYQDKPTGDRAFSPSAFPALGGMREGRRNSTGDVPSAIDPDDSDMESVKSLPLGAGSATGGRVEGTMSPIISYAKIAAGPKTICNKSGAAVAAWANKAEPEPESEPGRRHSLSSLTDPLSEHACPEALLPTQTVCSDTQPDDCVVPCEAKLDSSHAPQKEEAAIEAHVMSVSLKTEDQTIGSIVGIALEASRINEPPLERRTRNQSSRSESDISDNHKLDTPISTSIKFKTAEAVSLAPQAQQVPGHIDCASGLTFGSSCNSDAVPLLDQSEFPAIREMLATQKSIRPVFAASSQPASKAAPTSAPEQKAVSDSSQLALNPTSLIATTTPLQPLLQQQQQQQQQQQPPPKTVSVSVYASNNTATTTNNKKQKNKSVVFLDRRSHRSTQNLGISFGFDTNLEVVGCVVVPAVAIAAESEATIISTKLPISVPAVTPLPLSAEISDVKQAVCAFNGIVVPAKLPVTVVAAADHTTTTTSTTTTTAAVGACCAIESPNVVPLTQAPDTPVQEGGPNAVIQTIDPPSGGDVSPMGTAPVPVIENNKRVLNVDKLVPLERNVDPNFVRGRFHVEEIAYFLKEQWDHVMDKKNKHPGLVTHYSCQ